MPLVCAFVVCAGKGWYVSFFLSSRHRSAHECKCMSAGSKYHSLCVDSWESKSEAGFLYWYRNLDYSVCRIVDSDCVHWLAGDPWPGGGARHHGEGRLQHLIHRLRYTLKFFDSTYIHMVDGYTLYMYVCIIVYSSTLACV